MEVPQDIREKYGDCIKVWSFTAKFDPIISNPFSVPLRKLNDQSMLSGWLLQNGLPWLKSSCENLTTDSHEVLRYDQDMYGLIASPLRSYSDLHITAWRFNPPEHSYELQHVPEDAQWTSKVKIPQLKSYVSITYKKLGVGLVLDYFTQKKEMGVRCYLSNPPKWFLEQNPLVRWVLISPKILI